MINKKPKLPPVGTVINFQMNPEFDETFIFVGLEIPTSNKGYTPLESTLQTSISDLFPEIKYELFKKTEKPMGKYFMDEIRKRLFANKKSHWPYKKRLAVAVQIGGTKKQYAKKDMDNMLKMIFDSFNGIVFEDDNQIEMIFSMKKIWGVENNGFTISIRELEDYDDTFLFPQLYSHKYKQEWDNERAKNHKPHSFCSYGPIE